MTNRLVITLICAITFYSCSSTKEVTQPSIEQSVDTTQKTVDFSTLETPPKNWHHLDEQQTQFRGISSKLTYETIFQDRSSQKQIIVAVIDGGVDIKHSDLQANIWTNSDEIPNNQKDDDQNGYKDDVNGWNFIGGADGKNVNNDTFEVTRIYARLHPKFADADTTVLSAKAQKKYEYYKKIKKAYAYQINKQQRQYNNISSLEDSKKEAEKILSNYFSGSYTYEDIQAIQPQDKQMAFAKDVMTYVLENDIDSTVIAEQKKQLYEFMKYGYNPDFSPRDIVGDDYDNKTERYYGNNDVIGPDPSHGTHVAGIVGAVRNNGIGMNGVAANVQIMPIRAVPDGDERDKDVANAIRYAVDNGADVINMSFGKSYSPYKKQVDKAIRYANKKGVLMVHAAGNSSENTDQKENYPTDTYGDYFEGSETADLWLSIGASSWKPDSSFVGSFSNYGAERVDLFAPGVDIYSTTPDSKYERNQGTSMAAPVVSGTAALLMSYYPNLTSNQIRSVIMESVKKYPNQDVIIPHKANAEGTLADFDTLSVTGGVVNVYRALQAAEKVSNK
ncbi:Subtilase family protein [Fodinibius salinus]|uniref:Subtilase family protein n=1 Tax=Fodinibius salinus TaxID=860790 RepID=A0A5D3YKL4_9BACT|nr:S8 family peptidase [Fodinibius salinus]TYP94736.1 Subtilase family protein [Fodinibius salinus]